MNDSIRKMRVKPNKNDIYNKHNEKKEVEKKR